MWWAYRARPAVAPRYRWWVILGIVTAPWPIDLTRFFDASDVAAFERYRFRRLVQTYGSLVLGLVFFGAFACVLLSD